MPDFLTTPAPHEAAASFIATKPVVAQETFRQLLPELKPRAMVITGVEDANLVQSVREAIAEVPQGQDWHEVRDGIAEKVTPWLGDRAQGRAELLLRTHGFQAYAAAQYDVMQRQRGAFPFWQYQTAGDDRVRDSHAALDGKVLPADSPFWESHFPPWEWGCRCQVVPVQQSDVDEMKRTDARKKPEARRVLEGRHLRELEQNNRLITTGGPRGAPRMVSTPPSRTFTFRPGTLHMRAKDLRGRYDADTWANFENWAGRQKIDDGRTVLEWINDEPAPRTPPPPARPDPAEIPEPPAERPRRAPVSAALDVRTRGRHRHQIRHALEEIDRVHDDGDLPPVRIYGRLNNSLGKYTFTRDGRPVQIDIADVADKKGWPSLTTVHEIGHLLDHQVLGKRRGKFASAADPALERFRRAVADSAAVRTLEAHPSLHIRDYFLDPVELWARAYAQYIATRSQSPLLRAQLRTVLAGPQSWRQWSDDDFAPIANAIDDMFRAKGWLPDQT